MKQLTLSFVFVISGLFARPQCNFTIPASPGHVQVSSSQSMSLSGMVYWVCENVDLVVTASTGATIVLEQNATVTFDGSDGDQVYAKPGCVITNNSADAIGVAHDPTTTTLINNGSGTITTNATCNPLVYDYQFVGGSPCVGPNSIAEQGSSVEHKVFPNPVSPGGTIQFDGSPIQVEIFDITGAMVQRTATPGSSVDLGQLQAGQYILRMVFENRVVNHSIVVN